MDIKRAFVRRMLYLQKLFFKPFTKKRIIEIDKIPLQTRFNFCFNGDFSIIVTIILNRINFFPRNE